MSCTLDYDAGPPPVNVHVSRDTLRVDLADGRSIIAPTSWFPRLAEGTNEEWARFELDDLGIHWPDLDEDISVVGLLLGEKSGESAISFQHWLQARARGEKPWLEAGYRRVINPPHESAA